jgi:hypothetical protein
VQIDPASAGTTTVNDLKLLDRLSARVIRLTPIAGKAGGDLTVSLTPSKGTFGTTLSGWIYRQRSSTEARTSSQLQASNAVTGFGANSSGEVVVILINPSYVTDGVGITCEIKQKVGGPLGLLQNVLMHLPDGSAMYGLDIEAGLDDSVALTSDDITLYVEPRFTPSGGGTLSESIPVDYSILVDGKKVKSGVVIMDPSSNGSYADGSASVNIGKLALGKHTIRLDLDPDMKITDPKATDRDKYRLIDHPITVVSS